MSNLRSQLIPAPRSLELLGGDAPHSIFERIRVQQRAELPPSAYEIRLAADQIEIAHADDNGLRYARTTLSQLQTLHPGRVPCLRIEDAPAFQVRGFMLDVSRDRVPTTEHLKEIIDRLAELKCNHLQLYTEHTFAYAGHQTVWDASSPITPEQVRSLDEYASERGIELVANQNCFGHLSSWLRHPEYAHLAETHGEYDFYGIRRDGPFSLCPLDPGSLNLVRDLLSQLIPCFQSPLINIGCDETADVGAGRSADAVREYGSARVYADYVRSVSEIAISLGARPMFWADIALTHPEVLTQLPGELLPIAWGYEPSSPFEEWAATLNGREFWIAPGTSCWRSFVGRTMERKANLLAAAQTQAARGFLTTAWGDVGHRQTWPITLRALADAAAIAWTGHDLPQPESVDRFVFAEPGSGLSSWLDQLGDVDLSLRRKGGRLAPDQADTPLLNATALFEEMHPARRRPPVGTLQEWQQIQDAVLTLSRSRPELACELVSDEINHTVACAATAAELAIARRSGGRFDNARLQQLAAQQQSLWHHRSRPGGLEQSLAHWSSVDLSEVLS